MATTEAQSTDDQRINRRAYLAALSATAAAGLAGCGVDGDGAGYGGMELGERVPAVTLIAMSQLPGANGIEQVSQYIAQDVLTDALGVEASVTVKEFLTFFYTDRHK